MASSKIQQSINKKNSKLMFIFLLLGFTFSSCIQLRYTNYGKPFDFLKSKNQYHVLHKAKQDSASVFQANIETIKDSLKNNVASIIIPANTIHHAEKFSTNDNQELISESKQNPSTTKIKDSIFQSEHIPQKIQKNSTHHFKKRNHSNISEIKGPGWWEDFWNGIWNFLLKWLLIFLAFFILLALIIWGLYLLITVIAGPLAAGVFLAIVLILFWIMMNS